MAASDISREIFRETAYTTVPRTQKTNMMDRNRDKPFCPSRLLSISFIGNLHSPMRWESSTGAPYEAVGLPAVPRGGPP